MNSTYESNLQYRKRDENGDMIWGHGSRDYLTALEAMAEVLRSRLQAVRNEWWEGDDSALPWWSDVVTAYQTEENRQIIDLMIIQRIMDTRGVLGVDDVSSGLENRHYIFKCTVNTVYGQTPVEVTI